MPAGRRPKPSALKVMTGNPGKRALPKDEPKPKRGMPGKPTWLSKPARKYWPKIAAELDRMGVLTTADGTALGLLCDVLAHYIEARDMMEEEGLTYESESREGGVMIRPHPSVKIASDAWKRARAMAIEFGLTPAARAKVGGAGAGEKEENPFELLKRGA